MELKQNQELEKKVQNTQNRADRVEITFFTDPLCCWSWGFEPQWRRLQYELQDCLVFRYVMTGLLPSWKNFSDPLYSVNRPQQMGPVWMEAGKVSGMPVNDRLWVDDPPVSSYPSCIAVKSMQLQSQAAGTRYLRLLREAVMLRGENIAKQPVLLQAAQLLSDRYPGLVDLRRFAQDLTNDNGLEAFRADWQESQNKNISRTPTLIIRSSQHPAIMITGYRPYNVLEAAIEQAAPGMKNLGRPIDPLDYLNFWGSLTERELQETDGSASY